MKVKQTIITSHPPNTDKAYKKSETIFDIIGNKIKFKEFKGGKILVWEEFFYDSSYNLVEFIKYSGNSYKIEDYKPTIIKYEYDNSGNRITGDKWIEEIGLKGQKTFSTFHLNGTIKSRKHCNEQGLCYEENHFKKESLTRQILYNEFGNILEVRNFRSDGEPLNYTINSYNDKKQLWKIQSKSRTGNISEDRILKYNNEGLLIEDIDHPIDPNNAAADIVDSSNGYNRKYFYNSNKLIDKENLYLCGELIMVYKYSYLYW